MPMSEAPLPATPGWYHGARLFPHQQSAQIALPVGGIGTGTVSFTGNGALAEWQIFHRPRQLTALPHCFFALRVGSGRTARARLLESPLFPPFDRHPFRLRGQAYPGMGLGDGGQFGLPRFPDSRFLSAYPFGRVDLLDPAWPLAVSLEAWNPCLPGEAADSGLPVALFRLILTNRGAEPWPVTWLGCLGNPFPEAGTRPRWFEGNRARGVALESGRAEGPALALFSREREVTWQEGWPRPTPQFTRSLMYFWEEFASGQALRGAAVEGEDREPVGCLALAAELAPGQTQILEMGIGWHVPVVEYGLGEANDAGQVLNRPASATRWKARYAQTFPDVAAVVEYVGEHWARLREATETFRQALTLALDDPAQLDAVSTALVPLRSPTTLLLEDGTLYGFEGAGEDRGSCPGSCTHVWNYALAPVLLFPELARSMHSATLADNRAPSGSGAIAHRLRLPRGPRADEPNPVADGQLGLLIQVCLLTLRTGDRDWLEERWETLVAAMAFAEREWDAEGRGLVDGSHHCTYDVNLVSPNPLANGYYVAALAAMSRMAAVLGREESARRYRQRAEVAAAAMVGHLHNGEFFTQLPPATAADFQFTNGCLADQLTGLWLGRCAGLPPLVEESAVTGALEAVLRHNFQRRGWDEVCAERAFVLPGEEGVVNCTWPRGGRPAHPLPYASEAGWTGVEYQLAAHLLYCGRAEAAGRVVRAVRARHDGVRRNPFNEYECGSYYARSMAAWSLVLARSRFEADAAAGFMGLNFATLPRAHLFFLGGGWGLVSATADACTITVLGGEVRLRSLRLRGWMRPGVRLPNGSEPAPGGADTINFPEQVLAARAPWTLTRPRPTPGAGGGGPEESVGTPAGARD